MSIKGIDISKWQGSIDWTKVAADGVKVAIIRAGYGRETSQKDTYFEKNYSGATGVGIPLGAYHYSYAKTVAQAETEAAVCIGWLSGKSFDYPIYYDIEESSQAALGKATCTAMAKAFCEKIKAAGYKPGVYANKNFFTNYLDKTALQAAGYSLWIAHYGTSTDYSSQYDIHQYSSTGSVNGISGNVDMNYVFNQYSGSSSGSSSTGTTTAKAPSGADTIIKVHQGWYNSNYAPKTKFSISADGICGPNTKKAFIMAGQVECNKLGANLTVDGIWGTKTEAAFKKYVALKSGNKGSLVHIWQFILYCNGYTSLAIDEVFGAKTQTATKELQSKNSLTSDGVAGVNSFKKGYAGMAA